MELIKEINQYKKNGISGVGKSMLKDCLKEKCKYYNSYCEAAIDGCMFGASPDDRVAPCNMK